MSGDYETNFSDLANSLLPPSSAFFPGFPLQQWQYGMSNLDLGHDFEVDQQPAESAFHQSNVERPPQVDQAYEFSEWDTSDGIANSNDFSQPTSATQSDAGRSQQLQVGSMEICCIRLTQPAAKDEHNLRYQSPSSCFRLASLDFCYPI